MIDKIQKAREKIAEADVILIIITIFSWSNRSNSKRVATEVI